MSDEVVRQWATANESESGLIVWCPGCEEPHQVSTRGGPFQWAWDGVLDPLTIEPSILVSGVQWAESEHFHKPQHRVPAGAPIVCHSFIRGNRWVFLSDCTHTLAGETVPLTPFPEYWNRED